MWACGGCIKRNPLIDFLYLHNKQGITKEENLAEGQSTRAPKRSDQLFLIPLKINPAFLFTSAVSDVSGASRGSERSLACFIRPDGGTTLTGRSPHGQWGAASSRTRFCTAFPVVIFKIKPHPWAGVVVWWDTKKKKQNETCKIWLANRVRQSQRHCCW